jgi:hypothetical protein
MRAGVRGAVTMLVTATVVFAVPGAASSLASSAAGSCGSTRGWLLPSTARFPVRTPGWLAAGPMAVTDGNVWFSERRYRRHKTLSRVVSVGGGDGQVRRSVAMTNQFFAGFGATSAWFSDPYSDNWSELNPSTGARIAKFTPAQLVTDKGSYGGLWGYSVAVGNNTAWFLGRTHQGIAVSQVDLGTRVVKWTTVLPGAAQLQGGTGAGFGIAASEASSTSPSRVLVAVPSSVNNTNGLWSLDGNGAVVAQTSYPAPADELRDAFVALHGGNAYVVQYRSGYGQSTLTRYNPDTLQATATRAFYFPFTTVATDTGVSVVTEENDNGCSQLTLHRVDPVDLNDETAPVTVQTTVIGASGTSIWTLDGNDNRAPSYAPARLTQHTL